MFHFITFIYKYICVYILSCKKKMKVMTSWKVGDFEMATENVTRLRNKLLLH